MFYLRYIVIVILFMALSVGVVFTMGSKQLVPMKTYSVIGIPDGEFLHYGIYIGDEKSSDLYMVAKKVTDGNGKLFYLVYSDEITVSGEKKLPENYSNWPSFYLVDPARGSLIEAKVSYSTNDFQGNSPDDLKGMIYSHYQLYLNEGYVEYRSKKVKDNKTNEYKNRVRINPDFPSWDGNSAGYLSMRFMDVSSPGIMYIISPGGLKDPIPFTYRYVAKETMLTKVGKFRVNRAKTVLGDPFLGKLMEPILKKADLWFEDSDRRLLVKVDGFGQVLVLEEISNVK